MASTLLPALWGDILIALPAPYKDTASVVFPCTLIAHDEHLKDTACALHDVAPFPRNTRSVFRYISPQIRLRLSLPGTGRVLASLFNDCHAASWFLDAYVFKRESSPLKLTLTSTVRSDGTTRPTLDYRYSHNITSPGEEDNVVKALDLRYAAIRSSFGPFVTVLERDCSWRMPQPEVIKITRKSHAALCTAFPNITSLSVVNCGLSTLDDFCALGAQLTFLDVSTNTFDAIDPATLCRFSALKDLRCAHCALRDLNVLFALPALTALDASFNPLMRTSVEVSSSTIRILSMRGCSIRDVSFTCVAELQELDLSDNKIVEVPPSWLEFRDTLTTLKLDRCKLINVTQIGLMHALRTLTLSSNPDILPVRRTAHFGAPSVAADQVHEHFLYAWRSMPTVTCLDLSFTTPAAVPSSFLLDLAYCFPNLSVLKTNDVTLSPFGEEVTARDDVQRWCQRLVEVELSKVSEPSSPLLVDAFKNILSVTTSLVRLVLTEGVIVRSLLELLEQQYGGESVGGKSLAPLPCLRFLTLEAKERSFAEYRQGSRREKVASTDTLQLQGLKALQRLEILVMRRLGAVDTRHLRHCKALTEIDLTMCRLSKHNMDLTDITDPSQAAAFMLVYPLGPGTELYGVGLHELPNLRVLTLACCKISVTSLMETTLPICSGLVHVDLSLNAVKSLDGVEHMYRLRTMNLRRCDVTNVAPLERAHQVSVVNLFGNDEIRFGATPKKFGVTAVEDIRAIAAKLGDAPKKLSTSEIKRHFPHLADGLPTR